MSWQLEDFLADDSMQSSRHLSMILPVLLCARLLLHSNLIWIKSNSKLFPTCYQQLTQTTYTLTQFACQGLKMCFQVKQAPANFFDGMLLVLRATTKELKKRNPKTGSPKMLSDTNVVKPIQWIYEIQFLPGTILTPVGPDVGDREH